MKRYQLLNVKADEALLKMKTEIKELLDPKAIYEDGNIEFRTKDGFSLVITLTDCKLEVSFIIPPSKENVKYQNVMDLVEKHDHHIKTIKRWLHDCNLANNETMIKFNEFLSLK